MEATVQEKSKNHKILFWGCVIALVATGFGLVDRTQIIGEWAVEFNLTETQKGEISGVGF